MKKNTASPSRLGNLRVRAIPGRGTGTSGPAGPVPNIYMSTHAAAPEGQAALERAYAVCKKSMAAAEKPPDVPQYRPCYETGLDNQGNTCTP